MIDKTEILAEIKQADLTLTDRYQDVLTLNNDLNRKLVSFQANKQEKGNRWFKYKEGFSMALMQYIFDQVGLTAGHIIDPFAGAGTALFAASDAGMDATGIELLPSSAATIKAREILRHTDSDLLIAAIEKFQEECVWETPGSLKTFTHIVITNGAFPTDTETLLGRYLYEAEQIENTELNHVLIFAASCILEQISYTRKDGQYLRWDYRSGRRQGKKQFDKGTILGFTEAINAKLNDIVLDIRVADSQTDTSNLFENVKPLVPRGRVNLLTGSCLDLMPSLPENSFDGLITSPPYCNRYDYTRTYALELAMTGVGEQEIRGLRQALLSCTVENRDKADLASKYPAEVYEQARSAWASQDMLQRVLNYLEVCRLDKTINNNGIPRMVRNYFAELALVIFESARLLKPGAPLVMVNDNVRYVGAHLPVDLILSDFAQQAGFAVEAIWVLPRGKGNSSQQMGLHGREEVRKCVYVWRKT